MAEQNDPDELKGPDGSTLRQIHQQVKQSQQRDQLAQKQLNQRAQKQNRWQRFARYVWDEKRG